MWAFECSNHKVIICLQQGCVAFWKAPQAAQAEGGLGSSCCITQDYKEMYWDFNDLGKSNDLIMKLEINVLYLYIVVSCVPCVNLMPLRPVLVFEIPSGVSPSKRERRLATRLASRRQSRADKCGQNLPASKISPPGHSSINFPSHTCVSAK